MLEAMSSLPNPPPRVGSLPTSFWIRYALYLALTVSLAYIDVKVVRWIARLLF